MVRIERRCQRELDALPEEVREELAGAVAWLNRGQMLTMPLSRPMPSVGAGVHELRFRDRAGVYRVIYVFVRGGDVWLVHAFKKTTEKTPQRDVDVARERIREIQK